MSRNPDYKRTDIAEGLFVSAAIGVRFCFPGGCVDLFYLEKLFRFMHEEA